MLDIILHKSLRSGLYHCCLVNRTFYRMAVVYFYESPFTVDFFDEYYAHFAGHCFLPDVEAQSLYRTLVELVRRFTDKVSWLEARMPVIVPRLKNLTAVNLSNLNASISFPPICASNQLRSVAVCWLFIDQATKRWLERQTELRTLVTERRSISSDDRVSSIVLPKVRKLRGSYHLAKTIIPTSRILELDCQLSPENVRSLLTLLRDHSPDVRKVTLNMNDGDMFDSEVRHTQSAAILIRMSSFSNRWVQISPILGLPRLRELEVRGWSAADVETSLSLVRPMRRSCPQLRFARWIVQGRTQEGMSVFYLTFDNGTWTVHS